MRHGSTVMLSVYIDMNGEDCKRSIVPVSKVLCVAVSAPLWLVSLVALLWTVSCIGADIATQ